MPGRDEAPRRANRARRRRSSRGRLGLARIVALTVALTVAVPVAVLARGNGTSLLVPIGQAAPAPGESCPDETPRPGTSVEFCADTGIDVGGGGGGTGLGFLLPLLVAAAAGGLLALVVAYLVLRRQAAVPFAPADPGEWWTCPTCGKTNVIGSARCYACGTWQG
jgi:hypothetical protein